jgi:hypothetical protein
MGARVVSGPEGVCGYQISAAVLCYERRPREGSVGRRASMCQALLVKLRWSLVLRPCGCGERLGRGEQEAMLLSQPRYAGSWPSRDVRCLGLAPVSALDGSAECFTICTSRRARRLNFARTAPLIYIHCRLPTEVYCLLQPPSFSVVRNHTLFPAATAFIASILFPRTTEKTVQRPQHYTRNLHTPYQQQTS